MSEQRYIPAQGGQYQGAAPVQPAFAGAPQHNAPISTKKKGALSRKIALGGLVLTVIGLLTVAVAALTPGIWVPANLESIGAQPKTITVTQGGKKFLYLQEDRAYEAIVSWERRCLVQRENGEKVETVQERMLSYDKDGQHYLSIKEMTEPGKYQVACPVDGFVGDPVNVLARQTFAIGALTAMIGALVGIIAFVVSVIKRRS